MQMMNRGLHIVHVVQRNNDDMICCDKDISVLSAQMVPLSMSWPHVEQPSLQESGFVWVSDFPCSLSIAPLGKTRCNKDYSYLCSVHFLFTQFARRRE